MIFVSIKLIINKNITLQFHSIKLPQSINYISSNVAHLSDAWVIHFQDGTHYK